MATIFTLCFSSNWKCSHENSLWGRIWSVLGLAIGSEGISIGMAMFPLVAEKFEKLNKNKQIKKNITTYYS